MAAALLCLLAIIAGCESTGPTQPEVCQNDPGSAACACALDPASADCICASVGGYECECARNPEAAVCGSCPSGSARKLTRAALGDIGSGDWGNAELKIRCALEQTEDYARALRVQTQLQRRKTGNTGSRDAASTVPYTVLKDDQLGDIARKCLGNPDQFVEIAVLNGIENPSRVRPGQVLRIPTTKPCVDCTELRLAAEKTESDGDIEQALREITRAREVCRGDDDVRALYDRLRAANIDLLHDDAAAQLRDGATDNAKALWEKILQMDPENARARYYLDNLTEQ